MKLLVLVLMMAVLVLVSGCLEEIVIAGKTAMVTEENLGNAEGYFKEGTYYSYVAPTQELEGTTDVEDEITDIAQSFSTNNLDVIAILENLINDNVDVEEAWHKPGASSCSIPGSGLSQQSVVFPVLIIKVGGEPQETPENFVKTENPDIGFCAYKVRHYVFTE